MKKIVILILGLIIGIGLLLSGCGYSAPSSEQTSAKTPLDIPAKPPVVNELAPDFSLANLDGETVSLSDFRGKPVLINFWATWCGPCRFEMPFLQQIMDEYSDQGLVVLTVDIAENEETVEEFMRTLNLSLPVLMDKDEAVTNRYNIRYIPTTFLIDKNGIIQNIKIGAFADAAEIEKSLADIMP